MPDKVQERNAADGLLRYLSLPRSILVGRDREEPDFVLSVGGTLTGLEVTRVEVDDSPGGSNPRRSVSLWRRIVSNARSCFEATSALPVIVHVEFSNGAAVSKRNASGTAQQIAKLVSDGVATLPPSGTEDCAPVSLKNPHPFIQTIRIARTRVDLGSHWSAIVAGSVRYANRDDIERLLQKKERKLRAYRLVAEQSWLLVICNVTGDGVCIDPPPTPVDFSVSTEFQRVFCCDWAFWNYVEIPIAQPATRS